MTHTGKIGRLPKDSRNELGYRIEDGQTGAELVNWLNAQPEVREILEAQFAGRPISEQNLSDWEQGGHLEWLRHQQAREAALGLIEQASDLEDPVLERRLSDRFATVLASEITQLATAMLAQDAEPEKRWKLLCQIGRELSQLRLDDDRAARTAILQERWNSEQVRENHEEMQRHKAAETKNMTNILMQERNIARNADMLFGGGESGKNKAEMLFRLNCGLPIDDLLAKTSDGAGTDRPQASDPPRPDEKPCQTEVRCQAEVRRQDDIGCQAGVQRGEKPAKPQKSSLLKANKGKAKATNPNPTQPPSTT